MSESAWVSDLTSSSLWLTEWVKEKEAWISKESLVSPEQLSCASQCPCVCHPILIVIMQYVFYTHNRHCCHDRTYLLPRELSQIATCCLPCTKSWISSRPSPDSACFCAIRFRHDFNTSNDWATGDVGMHEHHTLVSNSFAGTHCML